MQPSFNDLSSCFGTSKNKNKNDHFSSLLFYLPRTISSLLRLEPQAESCKTPTPGFFVKVCYQELDGNILYNEYEGSLYFYSEGPELEFINIVDGLLGILKPARIQSQNENRVRSSVLRIVHERWNGNGNGNKNFPIQVNLFLRSVEMLDWELEIADEEFGITPATPEAVAKLESFLIVQQSGQCPICLEELKDGDKAICLPCAQTHTFHKGCISSWLLGRKIECPICRSQLQASAGGGGGAFTS